ncbi:MAG TPA: LLM class flavin-dependent oxidoreductase [Jatrophihabitans sp.]|jgi:alkanesulfonate monooxygenase SsuD/methylene tetrahydromethanopterin reductase-like flavin-dependent oxidoreductase (luciferase family)/predicted kinase|uniref:LLM class flavin-dependent oxidoreductase n=1 Tax=Jatrophihabitans sp. TaxID=1932789 RepID=UPI002E0AE5A6|nr:LLM class flavin-dependent oxidoreductase [Jatrophihabitans sp.]
MTASEPLPDPAVVVLVGASGAGKSTWAAARYRTQEIVSSDELRGVVGSGRHDLDASVDAFRLLDDIVAARLRRRLTCVIDTLGLDPDRRRGYLAAARAAGLPAAAVVFDVPAAAVRQRNAERDRPVPAPALATQLSRAADARAQVEIEGWDVVVRVEVEPVEPARVESTALAEESSALRDGPEVFLQVSRFPWGADPGEWLTSIARAADEAGFAGLALMDHLIQIPQVDRAWSPIPEPFVTLGLLAGLDTRLRLGPLVSPVTFRAPGIIAKTVATLDAISGGRAFLGLGAGWWEREHAAFGLPFPPPADRLDRLESSLEMIRALWSPGTKAFVGAHASLPETTCYPRPVSDIPIIVGGNGVRSLRIAARLADGVNLRGADETVGRLIDLAHGLRPELAVSVLDLPVVGRDREEVWQRVERLRGRTAAATFAASHHAGTYVEQRARYRALAERGVTSVFVALGHIESAQDVLDAAPMLG